MKRVLFVVEDLSCSGSPLSVLHIIKQLDTNFNKTVLVLSCNNSNDLIMQKEYESFSNRVIYKKIPHLVSRNFKFLYYIYIKKIWSYIKKEIKKEDYDTIYLNRYYISGIIAKKIKKSSNIKVIFHSLGEIRYDSKFIIQRNLRKLNINYLCKYADTFMAIAEKCFPSNVFKIDGEKVILHDYTDLEGLKDNKTFSPAGVLSVGQIGRFCDLKNQLFSLRLLEELRLQGVDMNLNLMGFSVDDYYMKKMKSFIEKKQLYKYVSFYEKDFDKISFFKKIDVLIVPSLSEGAPLVITEALSQKTPCISSLAISEESNYGNLERIDIVLFSDWVEYLAKEKCKYNVNFSMENLLEDFRKKIQVLF